MSEQPIAAWMVDVREWERTNMKTALRFFGVMIVLACLSSLSYAGLRGPGKYCGVPIFDRWGGCTLYSGVYVMYISEKVKDGLRPYRDKTVQINATDVFQPMNPGDGLIKQFQYLGPVPEDPALAGLKLKTSSAFKNDEKPSVLVEVRNDGDKPVRIRSEELAPTLLAKRGQSYTPADGPSFALVTRQGLWMGGEDEPRWHDGGAAHGEAYLWSMGEKQALPEYFILKPNEKRLIRIVFSLAEGQYDFLCGYGGGVHESECVCSNLTAFDVAKGGRGKNVSVER